ncbi:hypothetical protein BWI93_05550 [Siphonobacter sp. BAB-5385]|uniref:PH domain-containing protein n=1 Tax=Siphonobacter sp. BAB-5385 TaxID=1864822 RepID=UPI000B9E5C14|nr:PH domain-containing protein [Siphonobacter sp. BAB-5385]OZI09097.1 hypothetical protein BWI93_05550 [Siphonobacter sp. BAB-5385]
MIIYSSKIGFELVFPISILCLGLASFMAYQGIWVGLGIILLCSLFIIYTFSTTLYQMDTDTLRISSGFFFQECIEIKSIRKVSRSGNILQSPALSLDRIELIYNRFDSILLSPRDKAGFVAELLKRNPSIEVQL